MKRWLLLLLSACTQAAAPSSPAHPAASAASSAAPAPPPSAPVPAPLTLEELTPTNELPDEIDDVVEGRAPSAEHPEGTLVMASRAQLFEWDVHQQRVVRAANAGTNELRITRHNQTYYILTKKSNSLQIHVLDQEWNPLHTLELDARTMVDDGQENPEFVRNSDERAPLEKLELAVNDERIIVAGKPDNASLGPSLLVALFNHSGERLAVRRFWGAERTLPPRTIGVMGKYAVVLAHQFEGSRAGSDKARGPRGPLGLYTFDDSESLKWTELLHDLRTGVGTLSVVGERAIVVADGKCTLFDDATHARRPCAARSPSWVLTPQGALLAPPASSKGLRCASTWVSDHAYLACVPDVRPTTLRVFRPQ